jgi:hypothetical protein
MAWSPVGIWREPKQTGKRKYKHLTTQRTGKLAQKSTQLWSRCGAAPRIKMCVTFVHINHVPWAVRTAKPINFAWLRLMNCQTLNLRHSNHLFQTNADIHNLNTRHKRNLHVPLTNLSRVQKGVLYSGTKIFIHLPTYIKSSSKNTKQFKTKYSFSILYTAWRSSTKLLLNRIFINNLN